MISQDTKHKQVRPGDIIYSSGSSAASSHSSHGSDGTATPKNESAGTAATYYSSPVNSDPGMPPFADLAEQSSGTGAFAQSSPAGVSHSAPTRLDEAHIGFYNDSAHQFSTRPSDSVAMPSLAGSVAGASNGGDFRYASSFHGSPLSRGRPEQQGPHSAGSASAGAAIEESSPHHHQHLHRHRPSAPATPSVPHHLPSSPPHAHHAHSAGSPHSASISQRDDLDAASAMPSEELDDEDFSFTSSAHSVGSRLDDRMSAFDTMDHRSPLVTTLDVEVAVLKNAQVRRLDKDRLDACWSRLVARADPLRRLATSTSLRRQETAAQTGMFTADSTRPTAASDSTRLVRASAWADRAATEEHVDSFFTRHMDGVVEQYLISNNMEASLAQFRAHLPVQEQRLRTSLNQENYRRATLWDSPASGQHSTYGLTATDLELLANDAARRIRMSDDTLPWRPVDFETDSVRLEALSDELAAPATATMDLFGNTSGPTVGGSCMLLLEVLVLTERDSPYSAGVPSFNYTNVFMLLSGLFIAPDTFFSYMIRMFRSVKEWGRQSSARGVARRTSYLLKRIIECMSAYCIAHACELTFHHIQRISLFIESCGFAPPLKSFPVKSKDSPSAQGAFSEQGSSDNNSPSLQSDRRNHSRKRGAVSSGVTAYTGAAAARHGAHVGSGTPATNNNHNSGAGRRTPTLLRQFTALTAEVPGGAGDASRIGTVQQFSDEVCNAIIAFSIALQRFALKHYQYIPGDEEVLQKLAPARGSFQLPGTVASSGQPRPRMGTSPTIAKAAHPAVVNTSAEYLHVSLGTTPSATHDAGVILPADIDVQVFAHQLCMLSFRMFTSIHIHEVINNSWLDVDCKWCCAVHLNELVEYSLALRKWVAASIVSPPTWAECRRTFQHLLQVCRTLYDLQNYDMASAMLDGMRHPSVLTLIKVHEETVGEKLLVVSELRELETLQGLLDPFASYSPSSLNSVVARAAGELDSPMMPLLSPILGVLTRAEDNRGADTVFVRPRDGQFVVNWSKVMAIGRVVILLLRCQHTKYSYPIDPTLQDYFWSIKHHNWTDDAIAKLAVRVKQ